MFAFDVPIVPEKTLTFETDTFEDGLRRLIIHQLSGIRDTLPGDDSGFGHEKRVSV
jgi:hypothetical protein